MSQEFFQELENFLPVHVSIFPTLLHAGLVFALVFLVGFLISSKITHDSSNDIESTATEKKIQKYIYLGTTVVIGIFFADLTYNISWRLRNKKVNGKHLVYSRWFPKLYT